MEEPSQKMISLTTIGRVVQHESFIMPLSGSVRRIHLGSKQRGCHCVQAHLSPVCAL